MFAEIILLEQSLVMHSHPGNTCMDINEGMIVSIFIIEDQLMSIHHINYRKSLRSLNKLMLYTTIDRCRHKKTLDF